MKPRMLDLFSCAGGATKGYQQAGFHVTGVDITKQPHYCGDEFHQGDALNFLAEHGHKFDAIHASPPCQAYTLCQRIQDNEHPDLVAPTRDLLRQTGKPWVIENVEGAPLIDPVMLCGASFPELRVYRHRLFETSFPLQQLIHQPHIVPLRKMGRPPQPGEFMHVVGNFSGVAMARVAMGIDWMVRDELREAIPPAFSRYVGEQLLAHMARMEAAA